MSNDFVQDTAEQIYVKAGGDATGAITGAWAMLANYSRMGVAIAVSDAAEALTVSLQQAKDVSGTDAKTLNIGRVYLSDETTGVFTLVNETKAASYEIPADGAVVAVVEVVADDLDVNNDFVAAQCNISGSTARTQAMMYLMRGARYKPAGETAA